MYVIRWAAGFIGNVAGHSKKLLSVEKFLKLPGDRVKPETELPPLTKEDFEGLKSRYHASANNLEWQQPDK